MEVLLFLGTSATKLIGACSFDFYNSRNLQAKILLYMVNSCIKDHEYVESSSKLFVRLLFTEPTNHIYSPSHFEELIPWDSFYSPGSGPKVDRCSELRMSKTTNLLKVIFDI